MDAGSRDDAVLMQARDLARIDTQYAAQYLVCIFTEQGRARRGLARHLAEIQWRTGHQVSANSGVVDFTEHRIAGRASRIFAHQLTKGLIRPPRYTGTLEGPADFGQ